MAIWKKGETIDNRYDILDANYGGMGELYIVYDRLLKRKIAIKTPRYFYIAETALINQFLNEASVTLAVKGNDHIVTAYFVKIIDNRPCLLMEYIEGGNLRSLFPIYDLQLIVHLSIQICLGMWYLHDIMGIVHLDIKPENILVTNDGIVKITDFGIGSFISLPGSTDHASADIQGMIGTYAYMSPEQWRGRTGGRKSDIYSFGIVFYELLTKKLPFTGHNYEEWNHFHKSVIPLKPSKINHLIPTSMDTIVLKCLEKEPNKRPDSFGKIANELLAIYEQISGHEFNYEDLNTFAIRRG